MAAKQPLKHLRAQDRVLRMLATSTELSSRAQGQMRRSLYFIRLSQKAERFEAQGNLGKIVAAIIHIFVRVSKSTERRILPGGRASFRLIRDIS